jgi:hypothetical protein
LHHLVGRSDQPQAATHPTRLAETCGGSDCHAYAGDPRNRDFLATDPHDLDLTPWTSTRRLTPPPWLDRQSPWFRALGGLGLLVILMTLLWLAGSLFGGTVRGKPYAVLGGDRFKHHMLEMTRRKSRERRK